MFIFIPAIAEVDYSNTSTVTKNGLEFTAQTDKQEYFENEIVKIHWVAKNVGSDEISYIKSNPCTVGFSLRVFGSNLKQVNGLLSDTALLISENDPVLGKFDIQFYGDVIEMIEENPNQERGILIMTPDKDAVYDLLINLGISKINKAQNLSFVTAKVPVKEIPKIANNMIVKSIMDSEQPVCTMAVGVGFLTPGESVEGGFLWSQLVKSRDKEEPLQRVPGGYYSIDVKFNNISNCLIIEILDDEPLDSMPQTPCGLYSLPPYLSKQQIVEFYKNIISTDPKIIKSHGLPFDPVLVNQVIKISTDITNNDESTDVPIVYQIQIQDSTGNLIQKPHTGISLIEAGQTLNFEVPWTPDTPGLYTVEILIGSEVDNLSKTDSFNIVVNESSSIPILPNWIKNNAKWWADGQIDDESFVNGLQYMINEKIIHIPKFDVKKETTDKSLPPWIKNNAKWWAEGFISQREFIAGMKYLVENGIIRIS